MMASMLMTSSMEQAQSHIHYELVILLPVMSNYIISAFQQGHQAFPLVKVKTTDGNPHSHTYFSAYPFDHRERFICCTSTQRPNHYAHDKVVIASLF
jgi:hypothetical protein